MTWNFISTVIILPQFLVTEAGNAHVITHCLVLIDLHRVDVIDLSLGAVIATKHHALVVAQRCEGEAITWWRWSA